MIQRYETVNLPPSDTCSLWTKCVILSDSHPALWDTVSWFTRWLIQLLAPPPLVLLCIFVALYCLFIVITNLTALEFKQPLEFDGSRKFTGLTKLSKKKHQNVWSGWNCSFIRRANEKVALTAWWSDCTSLKGYIIFVVLSVVWIWTAYWLVQLFMFDVSKSK